SYKTAVGLVTFSQVVSYLAGKLVSTGSSSAPKVSVIISLCSCINRGVATLLQSVFHILFQYTENSLKVLSSFSPLSSSFS
ncbi:hypothetical protein, partial [Salmonella enterica]|uniref:hypothetical protein n=1 Tax=Salmonella enterica TaxID=28901 RepID=UPI001F43AE21